MTRKERRLTAAALAVLFGALTVWGPGFYPDTQSYIRMDIAREPLYPLFLLLCRSVAGAEGGLVLAVCLQNALCAFAVYFLYVSIRGAFPMPETHGKVSPGGRLFSLLLLAALLAPHVATPLFSSSHMILSDAILSEGLCYPLYQIFGTVLLRGLWGETGRLRAAGESFGLAFLLELLRGQMMIAAVIWAAAVCAMLLACGKKRRLCVPVCLAAVLLLGCRTPVIGLYNASVHGVFSSNTSNHLTMLASRLYTAGEDAEDAFAAEPMRTLFARMYDETERRQYSARFAGEGMQARALHQEAMHDRIKFEIVTPLLLDAVRNGAGTQETAGGEEESVQIDALAGEMARTLAGRDIGAQLTVYAAVFWCGLVRTAAFLHPGVNLAVTLGYVLLAALALRLLRRDRHSREAWFLGFVYVLIGINVSAVSMMIMCLSRYVVYNTPFLYAAALLVLRKSVQRRTKQWDIEN